MSRDGLVENVDKEKCCKVLNNIDERQRKLHLLREAKKEASRLAVYNARLRAYAIDCHMRLDFVLAANPQWRRLPTLNQLISLHRQKLKQVEKVDEKPVKEEIVVTGDSHPKFINPIVDAVLHPNKPQYVQL